jgi:hypothetical protein
MVIFRKAHNDECPECIALLDYYKRIVDFDKLNNQNPKI